MFQEQLVIVAQTEGWTDKQAWIHRTSKARGTIRAKC